jgi:hypothetical protein
LLSKFLALGGERARRGLRWLKSPEQHGVRLAPPGSFDSARQALCHAIDLWGAPLRMTVLSKLEKFSRKIDKVTGSQDDEVEGGGPPWHEWKWMDRVMDSFRLHRNLLGANAHVAAKLVDTFAIRIP